MKRRFLHPLDRYVLSEFLKILAATALGFPILVVIMDVTENLDRYLARNLKPLDIAQAYVFGVPETMFLVLPAAVLFATVFAIGAWLTVRLGTEGTTTRGSETLERLHRVRERLAPFLGRRGAAP